MNVDGYFIVVCDTVLHPWTSCLSKACADCNSLMACCEPFCRAQHISKHCAASWRAHNLAFQQIVFVDWGEGAAHTHNRYFIYRADDVLPCADFDAPSAPSGACLTPHGFAWLSQIAHPLHHCHHRQKFLHHCQCQPGRSWPQLSYALWVLADYWTELCNWCALLSHLCSNDTHKITANKDEHSMLLTAGWLLKWAFKLMYTTDPSLQTSHYTCSQCSYTMRQQKADIVCFWLQLHADPVANGVCPKVYSHSAS